MRPESIRILLISHTCQSPSEGQPRVRELLRSGGINLRVVVPDRWKHYGHWREPSIDPDLRQVIRPEPVRWPWAGPGQFYLHHYPGLPRVLIEHRPDVIDVWEEPWGLVSAQVCSLRARLLPDAKVLIETEQNIRKRLPPPFSWFRSFVLRRTDGLVARSREAEQVARACGYAGPSWVIPNGVDVDRFSPEGDGGSVDGFAVLYVGRLVAEKGLGDLLEAFAKLDGSARLVLAGEGPMRSELERRAASLGCVDRVKFLGAVAPQDLPAVMRGAGVLVLPSRTTARWKEQFGRVLAEAGACGIATVGSSSGAIPDVIGPAGLTYPEGDVAMLADRLRTLMSDPTLSRRLGQIGRRQAVEKYSWSQVARAYVDVYERLCERRPKSA